MQLTRFGSGVILLIKIKELAKTNYMGGLPSEITGTYLYWLA